VYIVISKTGLAGVSRLVADIDEGVPLYLHITIPFYLTSGHTAKQLHAALGNKA